VIRLSRTIRFNAGRRLWRSDWSREKNLATYGEEGPHGFGHNFTLEVAIEGEADPETGMVVNLTELDRVLKEEVDAHLDHRNLNLDVPAFRDRPPTGENLAMWIWDRVGARIARETWPCRLAYLRLVVTPEFAVEIEESEAG
jgi:6-pyruvoyltetrahydropterin/6-carboxytetrahydropterin synthase